MTKWSPAATRHWTSTDAVKKRKMVSGRASEKKRCELPPVGRSHTGWLERREPEVLKESKALPAAMAQSAPKGRKESRALPDEMDAMAQSVPKGRKASKGSKGCKASKGFKAHKASKEFQDLPALKGNPASFCRRVSHHS